MALKCDGYQLTDRFNASCHRGRAMEGCYSPTACNSSTYDTLLNSGPTCNNVVRPELISDYQHGSWMPFRKSSSKRSRNVEPPTSNLVSSATLSTGSEPSSDVVSENASRISVPRFGKRLSSDASLASHAASNPSKSFTDGLSEEGVARFGTSTKSADKKKKHWSSFLKIPRVGHSKRKTRRDPSDVVKRSDTSSLISDIGASVSQCAPSRQGSETAASNSAVSVSALSVSGREKSKPSRSLFSRLTGSKKKKSLSNLTVSRLSAHTKASDLGLSEVNPPPIPEAPQHRLNRLQSETREGLLHVLSQFQRNYIQLRDQAESSPGAEFGSVDESQLSFALNQIRSLIDSLFDTQRFTTAIHELEKADVTLARKWVSSNGQLKQGRAILEALTQRIETVQKHHRQEVYVQVEQLTAEVNLLRERIREAIEHGFSLLCNDDSSVVLPRCLLDATCVTTSNIRAAESPINSRFHHAITCVLRQDHYRRPVSEGFALVSEKSDLDQLEKKVDGRWGCYKLFERWLQESARWQWLDTFSRRDFVSNNIELQQLTKEKKKCFYEALDHRIAQLWLGRVVALRQDGILKFEELLQEAISQPKLPVARSTNDAILERAQMRLEDYRGYVDRFFLRSGAREYFAQMLRKPVVSYDTVVTPQDLSRLIKDAYALRFHLLKNSGLSETLSVRDSYDAMKRRLIAMDEEQRCFEKDHGLRMAKLEKERQGLKKKEQFMSTKLQEQLTKKAEREALERTVGREKSNVASLKTAYEKAVEESKRKAKEYEALKAAQKAAQLQAARLEKHIKIEEKKHQKLLEKIEKQRRQEEKSNVNGKSKGPVVQRLLKGVFSSARSATSHGSGLSVLSYHSPRVSMRKSIAGDSVDNDSVRSSILLDDGSAGQLSEIQEADTLSQCKSEPEIQPKKKQRSMLGKLGHAMHLTGSKHRRSASSELNRRSVTVASQLTSPELDYSPSTLKTSDEDFTQKQIGDRPRENSRRSSDDVMQYHLPLTNTEVSLHHGNGERFHRGRVPLPDELILPGKKESSSKSKIVLQETAPPVKTFDDYAEKREPLGRHVPRCPSFENSDKVSAGCISDMDTRSVSGYDPLNETKQKKKKKSWLQVLTGSRKKKAEKSDDTSESASIVSLPSKISSSRRSASVPGIIPHISPLKWAKSTKASKEKRPSILRSEEGSGKAKEVRASGSFSNSDVVSKDFPVDTEQRGDFEVETKVISDKGARFDVGPTASFRPLMLDSTPKPLITPDGSSPTQLGISGSASNVPPYQNVTGPGFSTPTAPLLDAGKKTRPETQATLDHFVTRGQSLNEFQHGSVSNKDSFGAQSGFSASPPTLLRRHASQSSDDMVLVNDLNITATAAVEPYATQAVNVNNRVTENELFSDKEENCEELGKNKTDTIRENDYHAHFNLAPVENESEKLGGKQQEPTCFSKSSFSPRFGYPLSMGHPSATPSSVLALERENGSLPDGQTNAEQLTRNTGSTEGSMEIPGFVRESGPSGRMSPPRSDGFGPITINIIRAPSSSASLQSHTSNDTDPSWYPTEKGDKVVDKIQKSASSNVHRGSNYENTICYVPWGSRSGARRVERERGPKSPRRILFITLLCKAVTSDCIDHIASMLTTVQLEENQVLFTPGSSVDYLYIVSEGTIHILKQDRSLVDTLGPGSLVLDREFVHGSLSSTYAVSATPATLHKISRTIFGRSVLEAQQKVQRRAVEALQSQESPLPDITSEAASAIVKHMKIEYYPFEDTFQCDTTGDDSDNLYVLLSGSCVSRECDERLKSKKTAQNSYISGQFLGARPLRGTPCQNTVVVRSTGGVSIGVIPLKEVFSIVPDIRLRLLSLSVGSEDNSSDHISPNSTKRTKDAKKHFLSVSRQKKVNANIARLFGSKKRKAAIKQKNGSNSMEHTRRNHSTPSLNDIGQDDAVPPLPDRPS